MHGMVLRFPLLTEQSADSEIQATGELPGGPQTPYQGDTLEESLSFHCPLNPSGCFENKVFIRADMSSSACHPKGSVTFLVYMHSDIIICSAAIRACT